jgi:hypothetical protein
MQLLNIAKLPIYLPYGKAPVPFGDPFTTGTVTSAAPGVFTVTGYNPLLNDAVQLSVSALSTATLNTAFTAGVTYYAVNITTASGTFSLSTVKNGTGQSTQAVNVQGPLTVHLVSNQFDGTLIPFETGGQVLAVNLSTAPIFLQGAADLNTASYGNPTGPGAYSLLTGVPAAGIPANSMALVTLNQDWMVTTSAGPGTLSLIQN